MVESVFAINCRDNVWIAPAGYNEAVIYKSFTMLFQVNTRVRTMEIAYFIFSVVSLIVVGFIFYGKYIFKRKKDAKKER